MLSPSLVILSGQQALQHAMDIVANNIANSNTTGFKREGIEFDTLLTQPEPGKTLNFVMDRATYRDSANGPIETTNNSLDLAIQGKGYFEVQLPNGSTGYTRNGAFQLDNQGNIVTLSGQPVLSDGGAPISVPNTVTDINISGDGFITAKIDNGTNLAQLGRIAVVKFDDDQKMQAQGNGIYITNQLATPSDDASVMQGSLEASNVQPVTEMSQMIQIMRSYEQATNLISQENTRLGDAISKLSKTTA